MENRLKLLITIPIVCFGFIFGCVSKEVVQQERSSTFNQIQMGDPADLVEALGLADKDTEKIGARMFELRQYKRPDGRLDVSIMVDLESKKVAAKERWFYKEDKYSQLNSLPELVGARKFKTFIPCHTWSNKDSILVDEEKGLYVGVANGRVSFVSWSTAELLKARIQFLYENCPDLQPKRK